MLKKYFNKKINLNKINFNKPVNNKSSLTKEDYINALEKMKKSPKDRVGLLGYIGITSGGIGSGVAVSGSIASVAGVSTLMGSSTLGSLLGGVFVTSTPIGWVLGAAALGGVGAYGLTRLIRSGEKAEIEKKKNQTALEKKIDQLNQNEKNQAQEIESSTNDLLTNLQNAVEIGYPQKKSNLILSKVLENKINTQKANRIVLSYIKSKSED